MLGETPLFQKYRQSTTKPFFRRINLKSNRRKSTRYEVNAMQEATDKPDYHSYILVCWLEEGQETVAGPPWRFRLEDPHSDERWGFISLTDVTAFLQLRLEEGRHSS
jgi:hypothetical protein